MVFYVFLGLATGATGKYLLSNKEAPPPSDAAPTEAAIQSTTTREPAAFNRSKIRKKPSRPNPPNPDTTEESNYRHPLSELVMQDPLRYKDKVEAVFSFDGDNLTYWERVDLFESYATSYLLFHGDAQETRETLETELRWIINFFDSHPEQVEFDEKRDYLMSFVDIHYQSLILLKERGASLFYNDYENLHSLITDLGWETRTICHSTIALNVFYFSFGKAPSPEGCHQNLEHVELELTLPPGLWDG